MELSIEDAFAVLQEETLKVALEANDRADLGSRMTSNSIPEQAWLDAARALALAVLKEARPQGKTHICDMEDCDDCNDKAGALLARIEKLGQ